MNTLNTIYKLALNISHCCCWGGGCCCAVSTHIGVRAIFYQGGGGEGGGEPFAQKILASCPNFYEKVKKKRGSYTML